MGTITDIEVSLNGQIEFFFIEQNNKIFAFNKENEKKIKWSDITKIGEDVVLVRIE